MYICITRPHLVNIKPLMESNFPKADMKQHKSPLSGTIMYSG